MARNISLFVVIALLCARSGADPLAQETAQRPNGSPYGASTTAILVDVVVRDGRGRPVLDLGAEEFAVFEDGVAQKIDSFSRVTRGGGIGIGVKFRNSGGTLAVNPTGAPPDEPLPAPSPNEESTTALVFDHLSSDALALAQRATLHYIPMNGDSETRVAVFASDPGVRIVQPYTTDRAAIREGVRKVLPAGTAASEQSSERRDQVMERRKQLAGELEAGAAGASSGTASGAAIGSELGAREQELKLLDMERSMIDSFDSMDREHRGYDTALSLMTVIGTLAEVPGRKSIVFFSEGLPVSPVLSAKLDHVIDYANRSNVTVYAVDARGLRTQSSTSEARKRMQEFAEQRLQQISTGSTRTDAPITQGMERVEDTIRLDSRTGLARLSGDTGGFLIDESNDLSSAFRRIDEDNQFHYLLTYSPKNPIGDGKYRTIQVKVQRSGVEVFSRKGYRAIRAPRSTESAPTFETPALAMLNGTPLPNAFPLSAAGFTFPDPQHPGVVPIVVRLATDALKYDVDATRNSYSAQVAVVVRLKDAQGKDIQTLSQQYVMSGDAKDVAAARKGTILFYREPHLAPGVYTMEAIALDVVANQGSARISTVTVRATDPSALGMSSLVLVDHVEQTESATPAPKASGEPERAAPFYMGNSLIYPNVGEPVSKSASATLPFYFTVYRGTNAPLTAAAQLLKNGRVLAEAPVALAGNDSPRVQQLGQFPISGLAAGTYELRIRVNSGAQEAVQSAYFTLRD
jgi:VWFA-related protein